MTKQTMHPVKMTEADIEASQKRRDEALARMGRIHLEKLDFAALKKLQMDSAMETVDTEATKLRTGEHSVLCDVDVDLVSGKAHYHRTDTGVWVYVRDVTSQERQAPLDFQKSADPKTVKISDAAKAKQPGLAAMPEDVAPTKAPLPESVELVVSPELRARIVEEVGEAYVDEVLSHMRDGYDAAPAIAIAKGMRDKAEKDAAPAEAAPEKPKKGKTKKEKDPIAAARVALLNEMKAALGKDIGTAAAFAVCDERMTKDEALAAGQEIQKLIEEDDAMREAFGNILEDVFTEGLSVSDAAHNAKLAAEKKADDDSIPFGDDDAAEEA